MTAASIEQRWEGKRAVAYSEAAFGSPEGRYVRILSFGGNWVELELLRPSTATPTGDIYLIPSVHIILKARVRISKGYPM